MREIKFRGKRIDNGEWVYGGYVHQTDLYGEVVDIHYIIDGTTTIDYDLGEIHQVIKETVGQFTGLKDKNGVEIYEGDTLSDWENDILEVKYDKTDGMFTITWDDIVSNFSIDDSKDFEVIGNIHDGVEDE
jgi:uncharacterized phage protein (TIGR01671 family)